MGDKSYICGSGLFFFFFCRAEDGIRVLVRSRGLGDVYKRQPLLVIWGTAGIAYVFFMFLVDVPMYWSRWLADEALGRQYMSFAQGLADVSSRWSVSHRWEDWQSEMAWMSLYSVSYTHLTLPTIYFV